MIQTCTNCSANTHTDAGLDPDELMSKYGDPLGIAPRDENWGCHPQFTLRAWIESESTSRYWSWVKEQIDLH
jgi:hypothetical protein